MIDLRRVGVRPLLVAAALTLAALGPTPRAWAAEGAGGRPAVGIPRRSGEETYMRRQWGVEVDGVHEAAGGYMLEFRYKVLDANLAKPLFERQTKPVLIHEESGAQLIVPTPATVGALRNSNLPQIGQLYWMFFANPGRFVKPGDHVTIEIGRFRVDDLVVE
jgi:hypothetical protein